MNYVDTYNRETAFVRFWAGSSAALTLLVIGGIVGSTLLYLHGQPLYVPIAGTTGALVLPIAFSIFEVALHAKKKAIIAEAHPLIISHPTLFGKVKGAKHD